MDRYVRQGLEEGDRWSERVPMDVLPASNGEFIPRPPTAQEREIMRLQDAEVDRQRRRFGMSRREFVRSAAAYGVGLWAIGQVMPSEWGSYVPGATEGWAAPMSDDACKLDFPESQLANLPGEFIFDVQSHHVDSGGLWRANNPGFHAVFAAIWEQSGPLGGRPNGSTTDWRVWGKGGEEDPIENLSLYHYLKELYLDSSTTMTVLSAVPSEESQQPLPLDEAAKSVGIINQLAGGSQRAVMHAFVMPNRGSYGTAGRGVNPLYMQAEFDMMEANVRAWGDRIAGWKVYTPWGDVPFASGWFLDDPVGVQFLEQVRRIGNIYGTPKTVACHKGFALPAFDQRTASPRDVGVAAPQFQDINFIVYHSGYDSERQGPYPGDDKVNSADRGVDCFVKALRENRWDARQHVKPGLAHGNVPNVYAEIGATMRSVMSDPAQLAHLLGKLITHVGPQRVVWGTDSLWFGSPQPVIVGLRTFEFSDKAKEEYNLPYGMQGDRFDPRVNAMDGNSYLVPHPAYPDWPTDGKPHPERTIRNGIFGRNAALPYRVDPDATRLKLACDAVQKIRDSYLVNPSVGARETLPGASLVMPAPRTKKQLLGISWPHAPWLP